MRATQPEDVEAAREAASAFGRRVLAPRVAEYRRANTFPVDIHRELGAAGLLGGVIPTEYGGAGMSYGAFMALIEEMSTYDHVMAGQASQASCLLGNGLLRFGTEAQKEKYLGPVCSGETIGTVAMTEPQGGSDLASIALKARPASDGGYTLSGQKTFVSHVGEASFLIVFAQAMEPGDRHGLTAFIVDRALPGIDVALIDGREVVPPHSWGQVFFDDVHVQPQALLGEVGDGLAVAKSALSVGRMAIAARACGAARQCLEAAVEYANNRMVFGKPIIRHQMVMSKVVDMALQVRIGHMLTADVAERLDSAQDDARVEAAMAKMYCAQMMEDVASACIDVFGAYGLTHDYPWEQYYRDSKAMQVAEGTDEIQRLIVGRSLMGQ